MRVLILGATGFAGGYLARELAQGGDEVWGAARPRHGAGDAAVPSAVRGEIPMLSCDVTDAGSVAAALAASEPEAVVVLAGLASPPAANRDPAAAYRVHTMGTVNVLEETLRFRPTTRVLLVTSSEVYGQVAAEDLPLTEESPLRPNSIYAASKAAADLAGRAFALTKEANVVRVRPFNHTGPGQKRAFVCPDFAGQVAAIARGDRDPVMEVGNLEARRDFSDVRDIVRGYVAALKKGRSAEVYNLCAEKAVRIGDILRDLCQLAGVDPEVRTASHRRRRAEVPAYWGSAAKARAELGWEPKIPWRRTLEDLLAAAPPESAATGSV